ncbi:MAG: RNA polymerase sigma factor for flagellar operon FliA [Candidatus Endobugula sp.]|jgi:RNA polymerase sigma factor for flagellar operon FliA
MTSEGIDLYEQAHQTTQVSPSSIEICVEDYAGLVKRIAQYMVAKMPASVQVDDLIQSGMIGLLEAAKKYDGSRGASFETYAGIRIRGAIVDEIRKGDWVPRSVHRNSRRISETIRQLEAKFGRDPKDSEVAQAMGVEIEDYYAMSSDALSGRLFSIEDSFEGDEAIISEDKPSPFIDPDASVQQQALRASLAQAIENLPEREKLVLSLYYDQELNLKEIGHILGVSESRISQIHSQAALRLRAKLKDWQPA